MPQRDGPRLEERDHEIWARYVGGWTQARLAAEYDVSQQRISQVLAEVRESIGDTARTDAALLAQERTNALLAAVWPAAMDGDTKAVLACLRVVERIAKALGTDAPEPLRVSLEQRLDVETGVVVDALGAALEVLQLDEERRQLAVQAAMAKLLGEPLPEVPVPVPVVEESKHDVEQARREAEFRALMAQDGVDADVLLAEDDQDVEDDDV